ncbi:MAG: hypothetical protein JXD23_04125 [Spirochaetales bacterium]|nr:hypothetical protein [Spirochaetales bacterium]
MSNTPLASSFRDPSGFLFFSNGVLFRQVNGGYRAHYVKLMESGLYAELTERGLLIPHEAADVRGTDDASLTIRPEPVPFVSYPYEWCFSQLKDAALATLAIQEAAFRRGMVLKDASAYNIQFHRGAPVLIDTLSFETYRPGRPWAAYRQFCQHFLAPLLLMSLRDVRLGQLLRVHLDGIPLDLASALLPAGTRFRPGVLSHIHLHAKSQRYFADKPDFGARKASIGVLAFEGLIDSLKSLVKKLDWEPAGTVWADYYENTNYQSTAFGHKREIVDRMLASLAPDHVWDLGANTGVFSRLAAGRNIFTVAFDIDPAAVELNYRACKKEGETNLLPLVIDLTNPSAPSGWENAERHSLLERGPVDTILALALVHHLAIGNNLPLGRLAAFFARACRRLIVEFVPKDDSQVRRMLATREDIFDAYTEAEFEKEFARLFDLKEKVPVRDSKRTVYLMERRS